MTTPIGIALLFLMAVGAGAAVAGDERRGAAPPPARSGVGRRGHDGRRGRARRAGARAGARRSGSAAFAVAGIVRQFASASAAARDGHAWPDRARAHVRNPRLYGGLVVHVGVVLHRGRAGGVVQRTRTKREVRLARGRVGDRARLHGHVPRLEHRAPRPEDDGVGATCDRAGRRRPRRVRARDLDVPEQPPGHRDAVRAHRAARGRVPHAGVVAERAGPGHDRRRRQPDGAVAVDRRRRHGARHADRAVAAVAAPDRLPSLDARTGGRARRATRTGGACRYEAPAAVDRARRRRVVVAVLAVVLALQVGDDRAPDASREPAPRRRRARVRPSRRSTARRVARLDLAGKAVDRELLELLVHPVPSGGPGPEVEFYERHRDEPDFAMVGIVRDDTDGARRAVRRRRRHRVAHGASTPAPRPRSTSGPAASPRRTRSRPTA